MGLLSPVMRIEAERLIKQARRDLENAAKNVEIEAYEVAAFLAEQAVEKYLVPFGVELLCYTAEEFARKREELGIVRTAVAEGVELR